jgi:hypothetical protein
VPTWLQFRYDKAVIPAPKHKGVKEQREHEARRTVFWAVRPSFRREPDVSGESLAPIFRVEILGLSIVSAGFLLHS